MVICQPKERAGLRLKHLEECNLSFIMQNLLASVTKKDALWVRIIRSKYLRGHLDMVHNIFRKKGSRLWRGRGPMCKARSSMMKGIKWAWGDN